jgi:hypothetical protein
MTAGIGRYCPPQFHGESRLPLPKVAFGPRIGRIDGDRLPLRRGQAEEQSTGSGASMSRRRWAECFIARKGRFAAAALALSSSAIAPAHAGSISANTGTYAGDVSGLNFPVGTVNVSNYTGYRHGGTYYDTSGIADRSGNLDVITNVTRIDWLAASISGMPFALSASLPYAHLDNAELGGQDQSAQSSFFSPNVFATLGVIVDPQNQRTLGISTYLLFPAGNYDSAKVVNAATPHQTVVVPQLSYEEGLGKFSPSLKNFWIDVFGGAAFHGDGDNPVTIGGAGFDRTEQRDSYDVNVYLRYSWNPLTFAALGIETSWGGEQIARGGALGALVGDVSLGKDAYVKGHVQFGFPLSESFQVSADLTHDFEREGGFKEDFTAEMRLSTFFLPESKPLN